MWYIYIVQCADGTLYTGITKDVKKRLDKHNSGKGAKYVRKRLPVKLLRSFMAQDRSEASKIEYKIKQLSRADKFNLIKGSIKIADL